MKRCLHSDAFGPYENDNKTFEIMRQLVGAKGLKFAGPHHEFYYLFRGEYRPTG